MKLIINLATFIALMAHYNLTLFAQEPNITKLESRLLQILDSANIPGLGIAVFDETGIVWNKRAGVQDTETGIPVKANTMFGAASLTKPIFAYAVLKICNAGLIHLDSPLVNYMPLQLVEKKYFKSKVMDPGFKDITTRMILSHSSGFPYWEQNNKKFRLLDKPGEVYHYSSQGYDYLQTVVEYMFKEDIESLINREVFKPLGMDHSVLKYDKKLKLVMANGHDPAGRSSPFTVSNGSAAGHLITTVNDYAKFLIHLFNNMGKVNFKALWEPQITFLPDSRIGNFHWGLGFGLRYEGEDKIVFHHGDYGNMKSYFIINTKIQKGLLFFSNGYYGLSIGNEMVKSVFRLDDPFFKWHRYEQYNSFSKRISRVILSSGIEAGIDFYHTNKSSNTHDETTLNTVANAVLEAGETQEAYKIYSLNLLEYPNYYDGYDSIGGWYLQQGDKKAAKNAFLKSIELNPRLSLYDQAVYKNSLANLELLISNTH